MALFANCASGASAELGAHTCNRTRQLSLIA
jgi:hypothetical protein